jgi:hypothetical protein
MKIPLFLLLGSLLLPQLSQHASAQCSTGNTTCVGSDCTSIGAVEYAYGTSTGNPGNRKFNSFQEDVWTSGYKNGYVETKTGFARLGNESMKHAVWGPDKLDSGLDKNGNPNIETGKRAELFDVSYDHPRKDAAGTAYYYWYGWSYFVPNDSNWSSPTLNQYMGQWRWSNIGNCILQRYCDNSTIGGSGHHLYYEGGKLSFDMEIPDTACATADRLKLVKTTLTTSLAKGVWVDFIMQAKWISDSTGSVKIWMQTNGGGYSNKMNYSGPTWPGKYYNISTCSKAGQITDAPNWQVGLYYSNDKPSINTPRTLFSDELLCYRTICPTTTGSEGWNKVFR